MTILDIEEAADFLKISRRSLETLVRQGKVPGAQLVGKWRFSQTQLIKHIENAAEKKLPLDTNDAEGEPVKNRRKRNPIPRHESN